MRRFRVSIAGLLAGIGVLAVSLAALTHPTGLWGHTFHTAMLVTLAMAVLGAIFSLGTRRAFWTGFAACGWAYFFWAIAGGPHGEGVGTTLPAYGSLPHAILEIAYPLLVTPRSDGSTRAGRLAPAGGPDGSMGGGINGGFRSMGAFGGPAPAAAYTEWQLWTTVQPLYYGNAAYSLAFGQIGNSIFCLLSALTGGMAARRFYERSRPGPAVTP